MPGWEAIPIVAVTASASREDQSKCHDAGANAFLAKPIEHDTLLRTIGTQLSLDWISTRPAPADVAEEDETDLVIPPAEEIEALWQLTQLGNMREIRERARHLQALDPAYAAFSNRLDALARGYHSLALTAFVVRYRDDKALQ